MSRAPVACPRCNSDIKTAYSPGKIQIDGRDTARCFRDHDGLGPVDFFTDDGSEARASRNPFARALAKGEAAPGMVRGVFPGLFLRSRCGMPALTEASLEELQPNEKHGIPKAHYTAARKLLKEATSQKLPVLMAGQYSGWDLVGIELRSPDLEHGPRPGDADPHGTPTTTRILGKRGVYVLDPCASPTVAVILFEGAWNPVAAAHDAWEHQNTDFAFCACGGSSAEPKTIRKTLDALFPDIPVVLVPDLDSPGLKLAKALKKSGIRMAKLPGTANDYREADPETRFQDLQDIVERALAAKDAREENPEAGPYSVTKGAICRTKDAGDDPSPLCNFNAWITEELIQDDGQSEDLVFRIEGRLQAGPTLPAVNVPAAAFGGMSWIAPAWGTRAVVFAGQSTKDHLRCGIQSLSSPERVRVYKSLGWRKTEGTWVYITAAGALGPHGFDPDVRVDLEGDKLGLYTLAEPLKGQALAAAFLTSARMLDLGPVEAAAPIWLAAFRAAVDDSALSIHLSGKWEGGKTELASLAAGHFGPGLDAKHPLESWESTPGAIERNLFLAQHGLGIVDDFRPQGGQKERAELLKKADRVLRGAYNRASRGRLSSDARTTRPSYYPRGLTLSTGEDLPDGSSLRTRVLMVEWCPSEETNWKLMTELQAARNKGTLAGLMAAFIQWMARDRDRILMDRKAAWKAATTEFRGMGGNRTADVCGDLWSAWPILRAFLQEVAKIPAAELDALQTRLWKAFCELMTDQKAHLAEADPCDRFIRGLQAVLASGRGHLGNGDGGRQLPMQWSSVCGWQGRGFEDRDGTPVEDPRGDCLGFLSLKKDEVWLISEAAFKAVEKMVDLNIGERALWARMQDRHLLKLERVCRNIARRSLPGQGQRDFRVLKLDSVFPDGPIKDTSDNKDISQNGENQAETRATIDTRTESTFRTGGDTPPLGFVHEKNAGYDEHDPVNVALESWP